MGRELKLYTHPLEEIGNS